VIAVNMSAAEARGLLSQPKKTRGRYNVVPVERRTMDGVVFASEAEMMRYADLQNLERAGEIFDLTRQISYDIEINGQHFCTYTPDHEYINKAGVPIIEEFKTGKSVREKDYKLRKLAFELYYGLKVTEIISR
jgi:hypothetical protein